MTITADFLKSEHKLNKVAFEWSIRVESKHSFVRDKAIIWLEALDDQNDINITELITVIRKSYCPEYLVQKLNILGNMLSSIGLGYSLSDGQIDALYIHTFDVISGVEKYEAYRWNTAANVKVDQYNSFFLPITPKGVKPQDYIHNEISTIFTRLSDLPRVKQLSTFWLRNVQDDVNQVCLTFSWCPTLSEYSEHLLSFSKEVTVQTTLIKYSDYHFRHIAFSGKNQKPSITLYFSGFVDPSSICTLDNLPHLANQEAKKRNKFLEQNVFSNLSSPIQTNAHVDLDNFYSTDHINHWKSVLGKNMYYHHGQFLPDECVDPISDVAFERAVQNISEFIPKKSKVYDLGCGWGGVSSYLRKTKQCHVVGITISKTQYQYCSSIDNITRYADMETTLPPGYFDVCLMLESLEHVKDKLIFLHNLKPFCEKLVVRINCQDASIEESAFGETMHMISSSQLKEIVEQSGWIIKHWKNIRAETMQSSIVWESRLNKIKLTDDAHLEIFRAFCARVNPMLDEWSRNNPLIELVAV